MSAEENVSRFHTDIEAAKTAAQKLNDEPTKDGKQRNPFKVYAVKTGAKEGYIVGQTPTSALGAAYDSLGITIDRVEGDKLPSVESFLSKLTPEEIETARRLLAAR